MQGHDCSILHGFKAMILGRLDTKIVCFHGGYKSCICARDKQTETHSSFLSMYADHIALMEKIKTKSGIQSLRHHCSRENYALRSSERKVLKVQAWTGF